MLKRLQSSILKSLAAGFETELLNTNINYLADFGNPQRFTNYALGIRELTRHFLHRLSPDEKIRNCPWYREETDNGDPSRRQRILYAIKGGLNDDFVKNVLDYDIDDLPKELVDAINTLSKYAHIEPKTFNLNPKEGEHFVIESLKAIDRFFRCIEEIRNEIALSLEAELQEVIREGLTIETIPALDELASHYWISCTDINDIQVLDIDEENVKILVVGSVSVVHQYGSDGDYSKGDGARFEMSYPFEVEINTIVSDPLKVEVETEMIVIDISDYFR